MLRELPVIRPVLNPAADFRLEPATEAGVHVTQHTKAFDALGTVLTGA